MPASDFLLVGGGLASATALERLLKSGVEGTRITLIGAEPELPYNRPPLSKGYLLDRETRESIFVKPQAFYEGAGVRLVLGTSVQRVDTTAHTIQTDHGDTYPYGKLLLAQGSALRRLTVPGSDLPHIFYLRTLADSDALKNAITRAHTAVVVGGSFIGMELASAFAQKGLQTTLLHRGKEVFDKLGSPEASRFFADYYAKHQVAIRTEDEATSFAKTPDGNAVAVTTKRSDTLTADIVAAG
ncbi:MAG: ferredoxin reductase, partial [Parcubacteria group bacterium Gr01-1014_106]